MKKYGYIILVSAGTAVIVTLVLKFLGMEDVGPIAGGVAGGIGGALAGTFYKK